MSLKVYSKSVLSHMTKIIFDSLMMKRFSKVFWILEMPYNMTYLWSLKNQITMEKSSNLVSSQNILFQIEQIPSHFRNWNASFYEKKIRNILFGIIFRYWKWLSHRDSLIEPKLLGAFFFRSTLNVRQDSFDEGVVFSLFLNEVD